jgi:hypothetical protein
VLEDNIKVHFKTGLNGVSWLHQADDIIQSQVLVKTNELKRFHDMAWNIS